MIVEKVYYIYLLASKRNGTIYTGVTNNLLKRIDEHKKNIYSGFTAKYNVKKLVYFEIFNDVRAAINREKNIKAWCRQWKIDLIEKENPTWRDLYYEIVRSS
ncbi:MAG: GIY-YIG nuclease family protein [Candidatus Falkowbacteria bacterium]|nr:GIY-YIG nuclease family protein [Candidatus Falkowbacteria bacterium]